MDADEVFLYLVAGAVEGAQKGFRSPSPLFQQALNKLTALQLIAGKTLPLTFNDVLDELEKPIGIWWPGPLPSFVKQEEIRPTWSILYERTPDDHWVEEFLERRGVRLRIGQPLQEFQADIDQSAIKDVQDICRKDPQALASVYSAIRRFLIEYPVTTLFELQQALGNFPQIPMKLINSFYEAPERFERYARYEGRYWLCSYCHGILNWGENGRTPRCARHSVCGKLFPDYRDRKPLVERHGLIRLKWGLHRRVCIPGIPEIELYEYAEQLHRAHPALLVSVILWPGVDRYDLQLRFADGAVWAVDVKDYADPIGLYRKLHEHEDSADIFDLGPLKWTQGFYVVPQYRLDWDRTYIDQFKRAAPQGQKPLPPRIQIVGQKRFQERVQEKLRELKSQPVGC